MGNIISATVLAITALLIYCQIREQTRFRKLEAYRHLYETLSSRESLNARHLVYSNKDKIMNKPYKEIHDDDTLRSAINKVTGDYDTMGKLIELKYLERPDIAYEMWGGSAYRMYSILCHYLNIDRIERNEGLPWDLKHSKYFEAFAKNSEDWFDKRYPRRRNKEPLF